MIRKILLIPFLLLLLGPTFAQNSSHLRVELLSEQKAVQPGGAVTVGFHFHIQQGWHIYWQNPGDSGQAPSITWSLPEGFTAGDIQWPAPQRLTLPSLADYGYKNEVTFLVPLQAPAGLKAGHLVRLSAHVRWLVCQEICIPGDIQLNLRLSVKKKKPVLNNRHEYIFQAARRSLPADLPEDWKVDGSLGAKEFHLSLDTGATVSKTATALFFPLHPNQIENAANQVVKVSGNSISLTLKRSDQLAQDVKSLEGVMVIKDKKSNKGYVVTIPLTGN